jgi:threonine dehydrogenase-like Zn-dependent dehydrogenase
VSPELSVAPTWATAAKWVYPAPGALRENGSFVQSTPTIMLLLSPSPNSDSDPKVFRAPVHGLTFKMAQTAVQRYLPMLLERIEKSEIDPSFVITHRASLEQRPELYKTFRDKKDGCIKLVMKP